MKTLLAICLFLMLAKYAVMQVIFSTMPGVVNVTYDRGPIALAAALAGLLVFLSVRSWLTKSKASQEAAPSHAPAHPVAI